MTWELDGDIDFTKYTESQLLQVVRRIDRARYPINYSNLIAALAARRYVVEETDNGLTISRLAAADGSTPDDAAQVLDFPVSFSLSTGPLSWLEPARNDLLLVGAGTISTDGTSVFVTGRRYGVVLGLPLERDVTLTWANVVNVEADANAVRFEVQEPNKRVCGMTVWLPDSSAAQRLAEALPQVRTASFTPQLAAHTDFEKRLFAKSPRTPATYALIAANLLVFAATLVAGAGWFSNTGSVQIDWGSNFGPFTTAGDWWRLGTALFVHFGVLHLLFNMWALASFGCMAERLYGRASYLLIYFSAGLCGSAASISWRPGVNSAGASAAIFGILGALLAGQLRSRKWIPRSVLRPLTASTLIFTGITLAAGMASARIDNAAHVGGLITGLLLGATLARSAIDEASPATDDLMKFPAVLLIASVLFGFGIWTAHRASATLTGEALYVHSAHWFQLKEGRVVQRWVSMAAAAKAHQLDDATFAKRAEVEVLPFWREARARAEAIYLAPDSENASGLGYLQSLTRGRVHAFELCVKALHLHDDQLATECVNENARVDRLIEERLRALHAKAQATT